MSKIKIYFYRDYIAIDASEKEKEELMTFNEKYHGLTIDDNIQITTEALDALKVINSLSETNPIITCRYERSKQKLRWHAHNLFVCPVTKLTTNKKSKFEILDPYVMEMDTPKEIKLVIDKELDG